MTDRSRHYFLCCLPLRLGALLISFCQLIVVGALAAGTWFTLTGMRTLAKSLYSPSSSETDGGDGFFFSFCTGQAVVFQRNYLTLLSPLRCITPCSLSLPSLGESYAVM